MVNLKRYKQPEQDYVPESTDDEPLVCSIKALIRKMILFEPRSRIPMDRAAEELKSLGGKSLAHCAQSPDSLKITRFKFYLTGDRSWVIGRQSQSYNNSVVTS